MAQGLNRKHSVSEEIAALEETAIAALKEAEAYSQLAQVGSALGIIEHEFQATIKSIRTSIRKLHPWALGTEELQPIYEDLKSNFDHLDSYLNLFTPLDRRLNRSRTVIRGREIAAYLGVIFEERFERDNIALKVSNAFSNQSVKEFPSTLYPTFVNVVDNASFWATKTSSGQKRFISLEIDEDDYLITNSGPGIERRDAERIFELGVTRKAGGRGMGLYISKTTLKREGWNLTLENMGIRNSPTFRISRLKESD